MDKENLAKFSLSIYGNITAYNEVLSQARCRIFYKGANRNGTYITDEFADKLVSTLPYVPVKGIYDSVKDDFTDHGRERYEGRIYGIVPENPHFAWEKHLDPDGVEREYACTDIFLFTGIYKEEALDIVQKAQSMELYADSIDGHWEFINGKRYFVFSEGRFLGLQALGQDYEPCFEGAAFYTLVDSIKNLITDVEKFELNQKIDMGGEKHMNFKLSDDQKYNMIWTLLNPRFDEENGYTMDYAVCDVYDDYAVVFNFENRVYERAYYTKDDSSDSLSIDKMERCYIMDVNEEEKKALDILHTMHNNTFTGIDETYSEMEEKINAQSTKIEEHEMTIATLNQDKESMEAELTQVQENYNASLEQIQTLTSENEELNNFKLGVELKEKEDVINKYGAQLDPEVLDAFKEKIGEYTKEDLDKELAFVLVQSKPTIFTKEVDKNQFIPKDEVPLTGIEAILSKYKK